jgi:hypothetical protein
VADPNKNEPYEETTMLSAAQPTELAMTAGFRFRPQHAGSIHDDSSARVYGYRGALVPGLMLYGYMANLVAESWGLDWVERGIMHSRSRRPVYEGDPIVIVAAPVQQNGAGRSVEMEVRDPAGNIIATGSASLPNVKPPLPDLADFPVLPIEKPLRPIAAGEFRAGDRFGCEREEISPDLHRESLSDFRQTWPVYAERGIVHPSKFAQVATHNALASYKLATPSIYVAATTQHLNLARVGDRLTSSGFITGVYERKGNHYAEQQHLIIANDTTPVAMVQRISIYSARKER